MNSKLAKELSDKYGVHLFQIEEVWNSFCNKISSEISNTNKKGEDGLYDPSKFKVIHIDNLGKFTPYLRNIKYANKGIKAKQDESITRK